MAKNMSGTGRVTVFSMLHDWPGGNYCVLAYATAGHFGDTAVLGVIPIEGNEFEPGDLFAMAGRHQPSSLYGQPAEHARAAWLACTGFSARLNPKPDTINFDDAAWSLDVTQQVTMVKPMYGHEHVAAGRFTLDDPQLLEHARAVLRVPVSVP
ncbi:hypothetical protein [Streptomyces sp. NPDC020298]|uniref:hypothetical protein n=1 Tax=unclassified Streptomyces TaxID=2593676 RepID=UPI0033E2A60E